MSDYLVQGLGTVNGVRLISFTNLHLNVNLRVKLDPYQVIQDLFDENRKLRLENADLKKQSGEYLSKWVAAQELASNRQFCALLGKVLTQDGKLLDPIKP